MTELYGVKLDNDEEDEEDGSATARKSVQHGHNRVKYQRRSSETFNSSYTS
jgi:hypothetical protein